MYRINAAAILFVLFFAMEVVSDDFENDDCSDSVMALSGCVFRNGMDLSSIVSQHCTACMEDSNNQDTSKFSCGELITHVSSSMGACQPECALPGCTLELTNMMTCFNVKSSDCELYTSKPSASPSAPPTLRPTTRPTLQPTVAPSDVPSDAPSDFPTLMPSGRPTHAPSGSPTQTLSDFPTRTPSLLPTTWTPTFGPSSTPTAGPSYSGLRKNTDTEESTTENGPFGPLLDLLQAMGGDDVAEDP